MPTREMPTRNMPSKNMPTLIPKKKSKLIEGILVGVLAIVIVLLPVASAQYGNYADIAGNYCRTRTGNNCCDGRIDSCSLPILGTLCYCDQFCDRPENPDCCPDYWNVCLGIVPTPPGNLEVACLLNGVQIPHLGKIKDNCNECTCKYGKLDCEEDDCLVDPELLNYIRNNENSLGWRAANYSQFWGRKLDEGLMRLTGTLKPDKQSIRMYPINLHYDMEQIPRSFDARRKWPNIGGARDQGWCGSSWAFSTIAVAEDRLMIASDGTEVVQLSPQNLLSCNRRGQQECHGGHVERAWSYLRKIGVVTEECYPYSSGFSGSSEPCKIKRQSSLQEDCPAMEFPMNRTELYSTEPAYRIGSYEGDIMWEIMTNGPVQALMRVYQDFFLYREGVYSRTNINSNSKFSIHSVKLLGWGEESSNYGPSSKYWVATNSWGENWGESGTFRIRRGTNESDIEQFILAVRTHLATDIKVLNRRRSRLGLFSRRQVPGYRH